MLYIFHMHNASTAGNVSVYLITFRFLQHGDLLLLRKPSNVVHAKALYNKGAEFLLSFEV